MLDRLLKMLETGQDSALLRFSLGNEYLGRGQSPEAVEHLRKAVAMDRGYSAAWKLLGKALEGGGDADAAADAWREGIAVAEEKGDKQAAKEMQVFLKRLNRRVP
jgi:Tfp pilus assembly protein PilF